MTKKNISAASDTLSSSQKVLSFSKGKALSLSELVTSSLQSSSLSQCSAVQTLIFDKCIRVLKGNRWHSFIEELVTQLQTRWRETTRDSAVPQRQQQQGTLPQAFRGEKGVQSWVPKQRTTMQEGPPDGRCGFQLKAGSWSVVKPEGEMQVLIPWLCSASSFSVSPPNPSGGDQRALGIQSKRDHFPESEGRQALPLIKGIFFSCNLCSISSCATKYTGKILLKTSSSSCLLKYHTILKGQNSQS